MLQLHKLSLGQHHPPISSDAMQMLQHPIGLNLTNQLLKLQPFTGTQNEDLLLCQKSQDCDCVYLIFSWTPLRSRFDPKDMKHCDSSVLSPSVLLSFKALQQAIRRILWGAPK